MAKLVRTLSGDFDRILQRVEKAVMDGSVSASKEDSWDIRDGASRCAVRVFERYSYAGGNRVSMNITLYQSGGAVHLCAITSGGSQGVFWKVNTWGEETFLETLKDALRDL